MSKSLLDTEKSDHFNWNVALFWFFPCPFLLPRARSLHYALFLSFRIFLNFFPCWYNLGTRCACCTTTIGYDWGQNHCRGGKAKSYPWAGFPIKVHPNYFQRRYFLGCYDRFSWEFHHSWTSWHSPFTDTQVPVNKMIYTVDYTRVHLPFPVSLLPPSYFYIPKIIHKSKQASCRWWHQHPQPMSHLCSSQCCHLARGCLGGPASVHVDHHGSSLHSSLLTRNFHLCYCQWFRNNCHQAHIIINF